jgi:hypothetical protein
MGASATASSQGARRGKGEMGRYVARAAAARGWFRSAVGRGDGVDGAPTGRVAILRDARRSDAARFWHAVQLMDTLLGTPPRHKKKRNN